MTFDVPITQGRIDHPTTTSLSRILIVYEKDWGPVDAMDSIDRIMRAVCHVFEIDKERLLSDSREEHIAWPRQVGMSLAYEQSQFGSQEIARRFGKRDHSTVLHACVRVEQRCSTEKKTKAQYDRVKALLA